MAKIDLTKYGITGTTEIVYNPSYELLFEEEMKPDLTGYDKGQLTELGAVNVMTGVYTGRSPNDKFIVMDDELQGYRVVDLRRVQERQPPRLQLRLGTPCKALAQKELSNKRLYVVDVLLRRQQGHPHGHPLHHGGSLAGPLRKEHVHPVPTDEELKDFEPDFVILQCLQGQGRKLQGTGPELRDCRGLQHHLPGAGHPEHLVRRRNEEGHVLHDELLPAPEGHRLYALLCQHRSWRARTPPSSSACPAPARPPCPPTPSVCSSATTSTAGTMTACSTSRAAATPRSSTWTRTPSPTSTTPSRRDALLENVTVDKDGKMRLRRQAPSPRTPACPTPSTTSRTLSGPSPPPPPPTM